MEVNSAAMIHDLQALLQSGQNVLDVKLQDSSTLKLSEVVRSVPGKRFVCRGIWHGKSVYAKLFVGNYDKRYAMRDKQGVEYLVQAHIVTPALLYAGAISDGSTQVLIFQTVESSENTEVVYQNTEDTIKRFELASKLVHVVAQHHNANLLQTDLYLKNFLIQDSLIFTLDGDGIRKYAKLSCHNALENISILLSKFDVIEIERWMHDLLKAYAEVRGWQQVPDVASMKDLVNQHRRRVTNAYADKKVFRSCTDVQVIQRTGLWAAISSRFSLHDLPKMPEDFDRLIESQSRIKSGNTCTVALAQVDSLNVVIKRYNIKSFWHGVNRALRQTRAARSWANAHRLILLGIPTAAPIALIESRNFGLKGRAYFLSEYVDAPDAVEFFSETADGALQVEAIINIVNLFYRLFLLQISHGDMKASNIKMVNGAPLLIDLDSMQQHRFYRPALKAHVRDLKRFMHNWQAMPALYNAFITQFKVIYTDHEVLCLARIVK
jgi:tRNA A-37 threonylcarbamoyl transferase component Bud32